MAIEKLTEKKKINPTHFGNKHLQNIQQLAEILKLMTQQKQQNYTKNRVL